MSRALIVSVVSLIAFAVSARADAQEHHPVGIVMGVPSILGVQWDVSDRVSLRPEFSFSVDAFNSSSSPSTDTWSMTTGFSALVDVRRFDAVRLYLVPRVSHTFGGGSSSFITTSSAAGGAVGVRCNLAPRFAVFAELGGLYTHTRLTNSSNSSTSVTVANGVNNRNLVGAVLFF